MSRLVIVGDSRSNACRWRASPTTMKSGAPMMYGYIADLKFAVEVFDERGNLKEVLARMHDLDAARGLQSLPDQNIRKKSCTYARAAASCSEAIRMQMRLVARRVF